MVLEPLKEYLRFLFASLVLRTLRGLVHLSQIFPWSQELCWAQEGQRRTERVLIMKHTWPLAEETNLLEKEETEKCLEIRGPQRLPGEGGIRAQPGRERLTFWEFTLFLSCQKSPQLFQALKTKAHWLGPLQARPQSFLCLCLGHSPDTCPGFLLSTLQKTSEQVSIGGHRGEWMCGICWDEVESSRREVSVPLLGSPEGLVLGL